MLAERARPSVQCSGWTDIATRGRRGGPRHREGRPRGRTGPARARRAPSRCSTPPAHDATGIGVDDERNVDEPHPGRDVRDVGQPQGVRARGLEHPVDPVRRTRERRHGRGRFHLRAPHHAAKTKLAHQPRDRAPHRDALTLELAPYLTPGDVLPQLRIAMGTRRLPAAVRVPSLALVVRRRGDRQLPADRLDPVLLTVRVDERRHVLGRRSSSAWAKYADALRRIVRPTKLQVLPLQRLEPLTLLACQPGPNPRIAFGPTNPLA